MKVKNSKLLLGAVMALLGAQGVSAETVKVGIAAEPYPPFASADAAGTWQGWEVDMIGAICTAAELECEISPVSWDGIIPALTSKKIDMIMASMSITPERSKTIDFSDKYYNTPSSIVGDKRLEMDATPEGLSGKILGVQAGTIHREYALKHFAPVVAEIKEYQTQDEANQDLAAGRIDATQADSLAMTAFLESDQGQMCCEFKGDAAGDLDILGPGIGIGLRQSEDELKAKLNNAIAAVRESGQYTEISDKYFDFDIYGE
ncbi:transporter substrate-binding domain-containing protein [Granulosicoccus antarcticus]|uniref:Histidine-binding periplasmic protein n=1 Tax=Granulosicoccus antarcticus IMCC3135 TaxID=1192854 RepID=A0A2Z2NU03_9GAMM|nr:transporter substrate-binding domain-containing protein [Granulosicoccus antarcticus]ASJ74789.1 Histidine-binding periplasmic protein [Granulosicoccus antarcticus IMCC3135]